MHLLTPNVVVEIFPNDGSQNPIAHGIQSDGGEQRWILHEGYDSYASPKSRVTLSEATSSPWTGIGSVTEFGEYVRDNWSSLSIWRYVKAKYTKYEDQTALPTSSSIASMMPDWPSPEAPSPPQIDTGTSEVSSGSSVWGYVFAKAPDVNRREEHWILLESYTAPSTTVSVNVGPITTYSQFYATFTAAWLPSNETFTLVNTRNNYYSQSSQLENDW